MSGQWLSLLALAFLAWLGARLLRRGPKGRWEWTAIVALAVLFGSLLASVLAHAYSVWLGSAPRLWKLMA